MGAAQPGLYARRLTGSLVSDVMEVRTNREGEAVPVLTGEAASLYLMHWCSAGAAAGVDARRLRADALRAQRGDRAALLRLRSGLRLRPVPVVRPVWRLPRRLPRSQRSRSSRCVRRARSPGRRSSTSAPLPPPACAGRAGDFLGELAVRPPRSCSELPDVDRSSPRAWPLQRFSGWWRLR
jgi:hypothetical protein